MNTLTQQETPRIIEMKPTPIQQVATFIAKCTRAGFPGEFTLSKTFDYALGLPVVYKRNNITERLDAALDLVLEALTLFNAELQSEMQQQAQEAVVGMAEAQEGEGTAEAVEEEEVPAQLV